MTNSGCAPLAARVAKKTGYLSVAGGYMSSILKKLDVCRRHAAAIRPSSMVPTIPQCGMLFADPRAPAIISTS